MRQWARKRTLILINSSTEQMVMKTITKEVKREGVSTQKQKKATCMRKRRRHSLDDSISNGNALQQTTAWNKTSKLWWWLPWVSLLFCQTLIKETHDDWQKRETRGKHASRQQSCKESGKWHQENLFCFPIFLPIFSQQREWKARDSKVLAFFLIQCYNVYKIRKIGTVLF